MFCNKCGNKLEDDARFCDKCGQAVVGKDNDALSQELKSAESKDVFDSSIELVDVDSRKSDGSEQNMGKQKRSGKFFYPVVILMALSIVCNFLVPLFSTGGVGGFLSGLVTLCWTVPMTIHVWMNYNSSHKIGIGFKICTLLFVSLVAGILLLCDNQEDANNQN